MHGTAPINMGMTGDGELRFSALPLLSWPSGLPTARQGKGPSRHRARAPNGVSPWCGMGTRREQPPHPACLTLFGVESPGKCPICMKHCGLPGASRFLQDAFLH